MAAPTLVRPTLESGDHLSRDEFHRRYCARPDIKKAELIEGIVYVASPVRIGHHAQPHGRIVGWLYSYTLLAPGLVLGDNGTVELEDDSEVQPDAFLWRPGDGNTHQTEDDYLEGAPQLAVEVAASSASYDLHQKLRLYERTGVREYVVWRVEDKAVDWFRLEAGRFMRVEPDAQGMIASSEFPGLRLLTAALLAGDDAAVVAALRPPPATSQP